jgi:hypothetical protein
MIAGKGGNDIMVGETVYGRSSDMQECDNIQYDLYTQQFRKTYKNCMTCKSLEAISFDAKKIGLWEYIRELLISIRLSRI